MGYYRIERSCFSEWGELYELKERKLGMKEIEN